MIIWINGAFGAGKTTIATELNKKIHPSFLYDPENLGDFFRTNIPSSLQKSDFQYYPEWREWNAYLLKKLHEDYTGDIIVPMTLYKTEAIDDIFGFLKKENIPLCHIQLEVSKETILSRLKERPPYLFEWGATKVDEILEAFNTFPQNDKIMNDKRPIKDVLSDIIKKIEQQR